MNQRQTVTLDLSEALKELSGEGFIGMKSQRCIFFQGDKVTFVPMELMPTDVFSSLKTIATNAQKVQATIEPERILNVKAPDEAREQQLKDAGVVLRGTADQCANKLEKERFTLYHRINKRKSRSKQKASNGQQISPQGSPNVVTPNGSTNVVTPQRSSMLATQAGYTVITPVGPSVINVNPDNIVRYYQPITLDITTPICPIIQTDIDNNINIGNTNTITVAQAMNARSFDLAEVLASEEPNRKTAPRRSKPADKEFCMSYFIKKQINKDAFIPISTMTKLTEMYEKLTKNIDENMILDPVDKELIDGLKTILNV